MGCVSNRGGVLWHVNWKPMINHRILRFQISRNTSILQLSGKIIPEQHLVPIYYWCSTIEASWNHKHGAPWCSIYYWCSNLLLMSINIEPQQFIIDVQKSSCWSNPNGRFAKVARGTQRVTCNSRESTWIAVCQAPGNPQYHPYGTRIPNSNRGWLAAITWPSLSG